MVNAVKLIVLLVFFGCMGVGILGFRAENTQPALNSGWLHLTAVYAAIFLVGPGVAVAGGVWGRSHLRKDFEDMVARPTPGIYSLIASIVLKYPAAYFLLLSLVCGLAIGYAAWGTAVLYERRHSVSADEIKCTIVASRILQNSTRMQLKLQCPVGRKSAAIELLINDIPAKLPGEIVLPVSKGILGTLFINGTNLRL
jgi:hypothetical protein